MTRSVFLTALATIACGCASIVGIEEVVIVDDDGGGSSSGASSSSGALPRDGGQCQSTDNRASICDNGKCRCQVNHGKWIDLPEVSCASSSSECQAACSCM